jgi:hypothetical protein
MLLPYIVYKDFNASNVLVEELKHDVQKWNYFEWTMNVLLEL